MSEGAVTDPPAQLTGHGERRSCCARVSPVFRTGGRIFGARQPFGAVALPARGSAASFRPFSRHRHGGQLGPIVYQSH